MVLAIAWCRHDGFMLYEPPTCSLYLHDFWGSEGNPTRDGALKRMG